MNLRWDPAVEHRGTAAQNFIKDYFGRNDRRAVLFCAGGFDNRSAVLPRLLASAMGKRLQVVALREERPTPEGVLGKRAELQIAEIEAACAKPPLIRSINVFDSDGAVIIGRRAIDAVREIALDDVTDLVVDLSALSIGASFPVVKWLDQGVAQKSRKNLHIFLVPAAPGGEVRNRELTEGVSYPHGFQGELGTDVAREAPKLWVPHLGSGRSRALEIVHAKLAPDEIVPVLPFPTVPARAGDDLLSEFIDEIESTWEVDPRNLLYANGHDPLDLYRSISRLSESRKAIFGDLKPSYVILTPLGSQPLTLGALMAAMEHNLPVGYVETLSYSPSKGEVSADLEGLTHIWLAGEAYP